MVVALNQGPIPDIEKRLEILRLSHTSDSDAAHCDVRADGHLEEEVCMGAVITAAGDLVERDHMHEGRPHGSPDHRS